MAFGQQRGRRAAPVGEAQPPQLQGLDDDLVAVVRVLYPGLDSSLGHALAARQMTGFGGMLTIAVQGGGAAASRVADRLGLLALAPSLGGAESLATQPCTTPHHGLTPEERARRGIADAIPGLTLNGHPQERLPNTLNVSFPGVSGRDLLARTPSVVASLGSACHAEAAGVSGVLGTMGLTAARAMGAVRLSIGEPTADDRIRRAADGLIAA
jgi:hypothetical protein